jgi:hypothetical protein
MGFANASPTMQSLRTLGASVLNGVEELACVIRRPWERHDGGSATHRKKCKPACRPVVRVYESVRRPLGG